MEKILVIGAGGQLGTDLTRELQIVFGEENVISADIREPLNRDGLFEVLNVLDKKSLSEIVRKHKVTQIYNLACILSVRAEEQPRKAWDTNVGGLLNVLDVAKEESVDKVYWPSSIAVFGRDTPSEQTPQISIMNPATVYGISKLTGERWCEYYHQKYGVDIRSLRYPGLVGFSAPPGGGTTDYAVDIYHDAVKKGRFESYLEKDTSLPLMYMKDAVDATLELMDADADQIKIRSSYNISAFSASPREIAASIRRHLPDFSITYKPDYREQIAEYWPRTIDDTIARKQWGWQHKYELDKMTDIMLNQVEAGIAEANYNG